jgi:hypothetical protein
MVTQPSNTMGKKPEMLCTLHDCQLQGSVRTQAPCWKPAFVYEVLRRCGQKGHLHTQAGRMAALVIPPAQAMLTSDVGAWSTSPPLKLCIIAGPPASAGTDPRCDPGRCGLSATMACQLGSRVLAGFFCPSVTSKFSGAASPCTHIHGVSH